MKKNLIIALSLLLCGNLFAQNEKMSNKDKTKNRTEVVKESNKLQKLKIDKASKKQAKQMKRDG